MMTRQTVISIVVAALCITACSVVPAQPLQIAHEGVHVNLARQERLCDLLATISDGESRTVVLTGVYAASYEHAIFYDPTTPKCKADVQPETWVEFAPGVASDELTEMLRRREGSWEPRRVFVTFTGELYGPGAVDPDDVSLPQLAAFANRTRNRRYGHLNGYRTKLVVTRVETVKSAPESVPSPSARFTGTTPVVESADVPRYPEMARNAGITGEVVLDVAVIGGQISNVEARSGDRMLTSEAIRNVKTWRFAADTSGKFTTRFSFNVESRDTGASTAPRIELQLPDHVRITAARNGW